MTAPLSNGGACHGHSGGPNSSRIDGSFEPAATTMTGDSPCYATSVARRLDTPAARALLAPFAALP